MSVSRRLCWHRKQNRVDSPVNTLTSWWSCKKRKHTQSRYVTRGVHGKRHERNRIRTILGAELYVYSDHSTLWHLVSQGEEVDGCLVRVSRSHNPWCPHLKVHDTKFVDHEEIKPPVIINKTVFNRECLSTWLIRGKPGSELQLYYLRWWF